MCAEDFLTLGALLGVADHRLVQLSVCHHRFLEHSDRSGERADFILAAAMGNFDVAAVGDRFGNMGDVRQRLDAAAPDHQRADAGKDHREHAEDRHPVSGAGDALLHLRVKLLGTIGVELRERGLLFVGIDVIDDQLTEINVTSPTGLRAIKNLGGPDIAALIWDKIEARRR